MKTLRQFKQVEFSDQRGSGDTLTVEYDNAGDPFREGLSFVFEDYRGDRVRVLLDEEDLRKLFSVFKETLFPTKPWEPAHYGDRFPEGCEYRLPGRVNWSPVPRHATKPDGWDNAQGFEYRIPDRP